MTYELFIVHPIIDGFVKSLFTGHCEERSGCEADPKQTRSLSFRTKKYNTWHHGNWDSSLGSERASQSPDFKQLQPFDGTYRRAQVESLMALSKAEGPMRLLRYARNDSTGDFLRNYQSLINKTMESERIEQITGVATSGFRWFLRFLSEMMPQPDLTWAYFQLPLIKPLVNSKGLTPTL